MFLFSICAQVDYGSAYGVIPFILCLEKKAQIAYTSESAHWIWCLLVWVYIVVPISLYACQHLIRASRSGKKLKILKISVHRGDVLDLQMSKPQGFEYRSGQYIYVKFPSISEFEWHPFSLISSPHKEYISVHIRQLGDWAKMINTLLSKVCQPLAANQIGLRIVDLMKEKTTKGLQSASVDGPFGAPAQDYKKSDVLLLVGLGIGVTPLISIVKDVLSGIKQQNMTKDEELENGTKNSSNMSPFSTSKVYFDWVAREQDFCECFKGVLD